MFKNITCVKYTIIDEEAHKKCDISGYNIDEECKPLVSRIRAIYRDETNRCMSHFSRESVQREKEERERERRRREKKTQSSQNESEIAGVFFFFSREGREFRFEYQKIDERKRVCSQTSNDPSKKRKKIRMII